MDQKGEKKGGDLSLIETISSLSRREGIVGVSCDAISSESFILKALTAESNACVAQQGCLESQPK